MSTSSASEGRRSTCATHSPACLGGGHVAVGLPGPNAGAIASGGASSSAFVPVPWRSGTIATTGRGRRRPAVLVDLAGVQRRAVAGHQQHAVRAPLAAHARCPPAAAALCAASRRSSIDLALPRRGPAPRPPARRSRPRSRPARRRRASAASTSATIAAASSRRAAAVSGGSSRCLARSKRLIGRTAKVAMQRLPSRPTAKSSDLLGHPPARAGVAQLRVDPQGGQAVDGLVGHQAVDQAGVRRPPRRRASSGWPAQRMNAAVGPLSTWPPTIGLTATTGASAARIASRIAGHGEDGADRDHRVGGPDHDRAGVGDAPPGPPASASRRALPRTPRPRTGFGRLRADHVLLERPPAPGVRARACAPGRRSSAAPARARRAPASARRAPRSAARLPPGAGGAAARSPGRGRRG